MTTLSIRRCVLFLLLLPAVVLAASCSSAETGDETSSDASADAFAAKYAELREQGKSHKAATELATLHVGGWVDGVNPAGTNDATDSEGQRAMDDSVVVARYSSPDGHESARRGQAAEGTNDATDSEGQRAMDAVVVVARYSSPDSHESARREQAVEELRTRFESRDLDDREALDLLDTIAPEASINERRQAAKKLAELSQTEDWDDRNTLEAAEEINRLITGDRIHVERRIAAAKELVRRSKAGDLDADSALNLMNDIAPGLSINERRQAAANLVRLSKTERWDAQTTKQAAEETFKLVTGGDLNIEKRTDAAVDLTGERLKRFGGDEFDDEDIDISTEMIKSAIKGDLTTDKVSDLLNLK